MGKQLIKFLSIYLFILSNLAFAQSGSLSKDNDQKTAADRVEESVRDMVSISEFNLENQGTLTIISDYEWAAIGEMLAPLFNGVDTEYRKLLGDAHQLNVVVRLRDSEKFYQETQAPRWTNAMYHKGQILIPMNQKNALDLDNLVRSIRHEYTHAVINKLSGGKAPGWLDEGLAQLLEGDENPILKPALLEWFAENKAISFDLLQGGFTKLKTDMVAVAYGQSLYAVKELIKNKGFSGIRSYINNLNSDKGRMEAFRDSFESEEKGLESRLRLVVLRAIASESKENQSSLQK